jgi:hypothetical protein
MKGSDEGLHSCCREPPLPHPSLCPDQASSSTKLLPRQSAAIFFVAYERACRDRCNDEEGGGDGEGGGEKKGGGEDGGGRVQRRERMRTQPGWCLRKEECIWRVRRAAAVVVTGAPSVHAAPLTDSLRSSAKLPRSPRKRFDV